MSENFIDRLAKIHTLDPEDLFEGFYSLFSQINKMSADELIVAKQAIDLGLVLSENSLDEKQELILIDIIRAMQMAAEERTTQAIGSSKRWFLRMLFYLKEKELLGFQYDAATKKIIEKPTSIETLGSEKKLFGLF